MAIPKAVRPLVTIEVKSPDDSFDDIIDKCLEYSALSVPNIVVANPEQKRQFVFSSANCLKLVDRVEILLPAGDSIHLPLDEMYREMEEYVIRRWRAPRSRQSDIRPAWRRGARA